MKYLLPVVLVFPIASTLLLGVADAQPITPAPDGTGTIVRPMGDASGEALRERFDIEGGKTSRDGANLFHSFQRFNLSKQQIANFLANPQLRNILARIVGGEASYIDGLIQISGGNPNLFLLNPAGIVFGPNASLNVPADFTAVTAHGIGFDQGWFTAIGSPNYAQLVGTPNQFAFTTAQPGAIVQAGNLTVSPGRNLRLFGGTIVNTGNLSAPGGEVTIAAVPGANLIRLSQPGHLLSLEMTPLMAQGTGLAAPSLPELLTGGKVSGATGLAVMPDGRVQLQGAGVVVPTEAGTAIVAGPVNAASPQTVGGNINIFGQQVGLLGADLNASGTRGGTVRIGGDYRGLGAVPNAQFTYTDAHSHIRADALSKGDGGRVIVWADDTTRFYGQISAQGGPEGGNGGFVETSGQLGLDITGARVDARAPQGQPGSWLLDPSDITISEGPTSPANPGPNFNPSGATANINAQQISDTLSQGTSVFITTAGGTGGQGNITVAAPIFKTAWVDDSIYGGNNIPGTEATLSLAADNNITVDRSIRSDYYPLNVRLSAPNGAIVINSAIATNGGSVVTQSRGLTAGAIDTSPIAYIPPPDLSPRVVPPRGFTTENAGDINLNVSTGNIRVATLRAEGLRGEGAGGNVSLQAPVGTVRVQSTLALDIFSPCLGASICTSGTPAGRVSITHGGGSDNYDFVVGNATNNGTAGAIVAQGTLSPTASFPVLPTGGTALNTPSGITITSINSPPSLTATLTLTGPRENETYAFPVSELQLVAIDPDGDRLSSNIPISLPGAGFVITSVDTGGTLQVQRSPLEAPVDVIPGQTRILPTDTLLYTPPPNTTGLEPGLRIAVQEVRNASFSPPLNTVERSVQFAIEPGLPPPPPPPPSPPSPPPPPSVPPPPEMIQNVRPELPIAQVPTTAIDTVIRPLEENFTRQFTDHLGQPMPPIRTRDEIQAILAQVERNEGIKPAIVYISFIPAALEGELPGVLQERRADDQLELVVVTREGPPIRKRLPTVRRSQVMDAAQEFRLLVAVPDEVTSTDYLPLAQRLYQWLIAPIAADLQAREIDNLVFIPDVGLRSLPFAALHDGQQFLIERYSVGLMPTVSLADTRYQDVREVSVLAMGLSEAVQGQQPLPATRSEIQGMLSLWPGRAYFDADFTEATLIRARRQTPYGIIHLATHGDFSPGNIANSYIQFWDGRLPLDRVRQLGFNSPAVDLLVLSACRTALGNEQAELGFAGLAYQAGVKTAVASLWYVSDAATAGLMTNFYATLKAVPIKAEALRRSQVNMATGKIRVTPTGLAGVATIDSLPLPPASLTGIATPDFSHPYYWAAFTTIGTPW